MSSWAYACHPCRGEGQWWVASAQVDEMPPAVQLLRVQVDGDWLCARVDRGRRVAVEGLLLREAVASDARDCPECTPSPVADVLQARPQASPHAEPRAHAAAAQVQAAAISLAGRHLVVVLVPLELVRSPGEADMLLADLRPRWGGVDLVLMGQADDGTPEYHGDATLRALLAGVPVDRMPWKTYALP